MMLRDFAACGKLFNSLFSVDYHLAIVISAVVIMFYTTTGGFLAASLTDFIQSIIMTAALTAGVVLSGILASTMSTSDSQLPAA